MSQALYSWGFFSLLKFSLGFFGCMFFTGFSAEQHVLLVTSGLNAIVGVSQAVRHLVANVKKTVSCLLKQ